MPKTSNLLANQLLQINAIKLQPDNPFTWASGWNSPIYTDMRMILSYPDIRNHVKVCMAAEILKHFPEVEAIAGVATGAIALGAVVADALALPFSYVRSSPKDHGLENLIEGNLKPGQKVVVIEDLVSTGGSSLKAVEAIRNAGCEVIGMTAIFTYEFPISIKRFREANINLITISNYSAMIEAALNTDYIRNEEVETLKEWRKDPANWAPAEEKLL